MTWVHGQWAKTISGRVISHKERKNVFRMEKKWRLPHELDLLRSKLSYIKNNTKNKRV